uniref:Uncharacterized protein n=1 Tax=Anguilla anguilla TaxID=7936 RepID=A0A0E9Q731_ANGAN
MEAEIGKQRRPTERSMMLGVSVRFIVTALLFHTITISFFVI